MSDKPDDFPIAFHVGGLCGIYSSTTSDSDAPNESSREVENGTKGKGKNGDMAKHDTLIFADAQETLPPELGELLNNPKDKRTKIIEFEKLKPT